MMTYVFGRKIAATLGLALFSLVSALAAPATPAGPDATITAPTPAPAASASPTSSADFNAAAYLLQQGRAQAALPLAERAAAAQPDNLAARDLLGQVLTKLDRPEEAIPTLAKVVDSDPKNVDALVHLGEAEMTQFAKSITAWKRVHGDNPMLGTITSDIPGALAGGTPRYMPEGGPVLGETDKVSELTRNPMEARNPRFDPGHSAMGMLRRSVTSMNARERERFEEPARNALARFDQALTLAPDAPAALRGRAFALYALGDYPTAGGAFEKAAGAASTDAYLYEMAADAYQRSDSPNDAIRALESVVRLNPSDVMAYSSLEDLYGTFRRSRWERRYYQAMEHLLAGKPKDALNDLEWVTARHPDFAPGWRATGSAHLLLKNQDKAIENLDKALQLDPEDGLTEYELGVAHLRGGALPNAHEHLTKAAKLRPDYAPAWFSLGVLAEKEKDPDSAIMAYEKAVTLRPNWAEAHYNLGAILLDRRQGAEAVEHLERYIALKPNATDARDVRKTVEQVKSLEKQG